jgi:formylglycine-generating enzyme
MPRLCSMLLSSLVIASSASAVTMDWTPIGKPGNACDTQLSNCFGDVEYDYYVGTYEVTNAQYVDFLNAKAVSDPLGLYNTFMADSASWGGIARSGSPGSYSYSVLEGRGNMPVNWVSFYDTLRFANWMNNGQGNSDTETGAYTLLGATPTPSNGTTVTRNEGATIALTSEDEWYKAAYYDRSIASNYYSFPTGSDTQPECAAPTPVPGHANCDRQVFDLTVVGSYAGSASPWGTFDQGGNVNEWTETSANDGQGRRYRGGDYVNSVQRVHARFRGSLSSASERDTIGFRLAMIPGGYVVPEPSTALLVIAGLLGLAGWRGVRA